jgi:ribosome-associated protein
VLKLSANVAFAEYFLLCSGQSHPQLQAIAEAIEENLESHGVRTTHREGKSDAEWRLLDYGGFVVHIFSTRAREYYDLERLWRNAERWDADVEGSEQQNPQPLGPEHGEAQA